MGKEGLYQIENAKTNTIFHMFWTLSIIIYWLRWEWLTGLKFEQNLQGRNQGAGTMLTQLSEFHFKVKLVFSPRDIFALHFSLFHFQNIEEELGKGKDIFLSDHLGPILWRCWRWKEEDEDWSVIETQRISDEMGTGKHWKMLLLWLFVWTWWFSMVQHTTQRP